MRRLVGPTLALAALVACGSDSRTPTTSEAQVDLAQWSRITATGTFAGMLWPREATDGPATVRDERDDTGWVPPPGEPATLRLDWQPWFGTVARLEAMEVAFAGDPTPITVTFFDACVGNEIEARAWTDPTVPLVLDVEAGCAELTIPEPGDVRVTELRLVGRVEGLAEAAPRATDVADETEIGSPSYGVIEGFYGVPWSWRERGSMVRGLSRHGMGTFMYAPKWDPLHRDEWRTPYEDDFLARFGAFAALAADQGVDVVAGVSPFGNWDGDTAPAVLRDKLRAFADAGVRSFALLADDIEFLTTRPIDAALGAEHAEVVNDVLAVLRDEYGAVTMWFVPTVYDGDRRAELGQGDAYLVALRALDEDVRVMWTGDDTFDESMLAADFDDVTELLGRAPYVWDNYWANDGGDGFTGRLLLAPYDDRDPELRDVVGGVANNASIMGAVARLQLHAFAYWANDGGGDRDAVRRFVAETEAAWASPRQPLARTAELVETVLRTADGATNDTPANVDLEAAVDAIGAALGAATPDVESVRLALAVFARQAGLRGELYHSAVDPDLVDDLWFPLERVEAEAQAGLWRMVELRDRLAGEDPTEAQALARAAELQASRARFQVSPGVVARFGRLVESSAALDGGTPTALETAPGTPPCTSRQELTWTPFPGADWLAVGGLPGARTTGGMLAWTPPHAGSYAAIVVGTDPTGDAWDVRYLELHCGHPPR